MRKKKHSQKCTRAIAGIMAFAMTAGSLFGIGPASTAKADTASGTGILAGLNDFSMSDVTVTDPYYVNVAQKDIDFLKTFNVDKLLARYREIAGLSTKGASSYAGWETTQIAGHTLGHYLTACAQAYLTAPKESDRTWMKNRVQTLIDGLLECQNSTNGKGYKDGFVFGTIINDANNKEYQFDVVEGKIQGSHWVPWYNMHKLMTGIVAVYNHVGYEPAKTLGSKLGDWVYNRASSWNESTRSKVLNVEFGGMNDCLYDLYKITGKQNHLTAAHLFDQDTLFADVAKGTTNVLTNKHANTTIPKYLGIVNRVGTLNDTLTTAESARYLNYAEVFWNMVNERHTYITGANSQWEHFRADYALDEQRTQCNNETCNVHNLLLLSRRLFKITGDKKYADFYENAFINSIMASVNPENATTTYFQPMATGYYKVYSDPDVNKNLFWCCTGTGLENFTKLGDSIYFHKDSTLVVNQYLSSSLNWSEKNVKLTQQTDIPNTDTAKFTINTSGNTKFALALRLPDWLAGDAVIKVNNTAYTAEIIDGYAFIDRTWSNDDTVTIQLPMEVVAYDLPDSETTLAFKYGPIVLAAELGEDDLMAKRSSCGWWVALPENKRVGTDTANPGDGQRSVLKSETLILDNVSVDYFAKNINDFLVREDGLNFTLNNTKLTTTGETLTFSPYYTLHDQRYGVYWYFSGLGSNPDQDAILKQKQDGRDGRTKIDGLRAGYRVQDEEDAVHQIQDNNGTSSTGNQADPDLNAPSRYANRNGSFTYRMIVDKEQTNYLVLQLAKADNGKTLKITSGNTALFEETLDNKGEQELYKVRVKIPAEVASAAETITVSSGAEEKTVTVVPITFAGINGAESARLVGEQSINTEYSNNPGIKNIIEANGTTAKDDDDTFTVTVPGDADEANLEFELEDQFGLLYVNYTLVDDSLPQKISLVDDETTVPVKVYGEDHTTVREYTLKIKKDVEIAVELDVFKYFTFDDTLSDSKSGTNAVTVSGGGYKNPTEVQSTPVYTDGKYGKAIKLNGSYGLSLGATKGIGEDYTISWWMKPDQIKGQYDPLFCGGTFTNPEYWVSATHDAKVWSNDGTKRSMSAANAYKAGEWQHVVITIKGGANPSDLSFGKLYLNGELITSGEVTPNTLERDNAMAYFGVNYWDGVYSGEVDDLVMIRGVLNKLEVNALKDHFLSPDKEENDFNASGAVIDKINAIGTVTFSPESKALIDAARKGYERLTDDQKALVNNLDVLVSAEKYYQTLKEIEESKIPDPTPSPQTGPGNNAADPGKDNSGNNIIGHTIEVKKAKITKLLAAKAGTLKVKWKKMKLINGYEIQYSVKKSFKKKITKTVNVKKAKTKTLTIKKLKRGKRYFVRVRAYRKMGTEIIYGKWSRPVSKKVK